MALRHFVVSTVVVVDDPATPEERRRAPAGIIGPLVLSAAISEARRHFYDWSNGRSAPLKVEEIVSFYRTGATNDF